MYTKDGSQWWKSFVQKKKIEKKKIFFDFFF